MILHDAVFFLVVAFVFSVSLLAGFNIVF